MNKQLIFRWIAFGINSLMAAWLVVAAGVLVYFAIMMDVGIPKLLTSIASHPIHLTLAIFAFIIIGLLPVSYNFHKNRRNKIIFCSTITVMALTTTILLSI